MKWEITEDDTCSIDNDVGDYWRWDMYYMYWLIDWVRGLMTHQPLRVILGHLQEKGRREIVEEMKERDRGEKKINES